MRHLPTLTALGALLAAGTATAQTVTLDFNDAIQGRPYYAYDADSDGVEDVVLSTSDALGFNTFGPGLNMLYIREPGIEGNALQTEDLRANFVRGASGSLAFSYALSTQDTDYGVTAKVFDVENNLLASISNTAAFQATGGSEFGVGSFPENRVTVNFGGTAAYATFDFGTSENPTEGGQPSRYIIDDLTLTFAGGVTLPGFHGVLPSDPILPQATTVNADGSLSFDFSLIPVTGGLGVAFPIFIDPDVAVGYDYKVSGGPNISAVIVPAALANGDANFSLEIDGVGSFALQAGVEFDVTSVVAGGVNAFRIVGIDTAAGLDPTSPTAFVTGLRFVSAGSAQVSQTAIVETVVSAVPEPSTYALMLLGVGALAWRQRRVLRHTH